MKTKKTLIILGLLPQVGSIFTSDFFDQGTAIMDTLQSFDDMKDKSSTSHWKPTGPTDEDIKAATKIDGLAVKGTPEEKLLNALKGGSLNKIDNIIAMVTNFEARDANNMTAFMIAAEKGYSDVSSKLIKAGADVNARDKFGLTAMSHAVRNNHTEVVKIIVASGLLKDSKEVDSWFVTAVYNSNYEMAKAFLDANNVDIPYNGLKHAYYISINNGSTKISNAIEEKMNKS